MTLHINTPLLRSTAMSRADGSQIWLKMEALQPSGSFKIRGVGHACEIHLGQGKESFVSSSGGNAGLAVAYAGRQLGAHVTVVVPQTTTDKVKELIRQEQAELIVHGKSWDEAHALALELVTPGSVMIHPFDDPLLWEGHATMVDELAAVSFRPDLVVVSVGGGGLLAGVLTGLTRNGWSQVPIIAVETTGTASFNAAMAAKRVVQIAKVDGVATSLGARQVSVGAFRLSQKHNVRSVLVSDLQAVRACQRFFEHHGVLVEPACGAALAVGEDPSIHQRPHENVLIIVCGGSTSNASMMAHWEKTLSQSQQED